MTTATRKRTTPLAELGEREQVWADAKAEASRLGTDYGVKFQRAQALTDQRRSLAVREPGLVDHHGNPNPDVEDNPVAAVDHELAALGDLADLQARMHHARSLEERAKQAANDYTATHLDEILTGLEPEANATVAEVVRCMAELATAADAYLNMARRVDGLKGADRQRQHLRVPAIDTGSDLVRHARGYQPPPSPTEIR